jgi:thioredoxin
MKKCILIILTIILTGCFIPHSDVPTSKELLHFYANWCGPCKVFEPIVKEAESEYAGSVDFTHYDIDIEDEIDAQYHIVSIPTCVLLFNGQEIDRVVGKIDKNALISFIEHD